MKRVKIIPFKSLVNAILLSKSYGSKLRGIVFIILLCVKPAAGLWVSVLIVASRLFPQRFLNLEKM
jgi:hypothetical protein